MEFVDIPANKWTLIASNAASVKVWPRADKPVHFWWAAKPKGDPPPADSDVSQTMPLDADGCLDLALDECCDIYLYARGYDGQVYVCEDGQDAQAAPVGV
jgi:hypothetical protein